MGILVHKIFESIFSQNEDSEDIVCATIDEFWNSDYFENELQSAEYKMEALEMLLKYFRYNPMDKNIIHFSEKEIQIKLSSDVYRGKLDRIDIDDSKIHIIDYKTSKKKKTKNSLFKDIQLAYYCYLLYKSDGDEKINGLPDYATLEFIRDAEDPSVTVEFNEEHMLETEKRIMNISENIKRSLFTPKKNSACFYCDYKRLLCPLYK